MSDSNPLSTPSTDFVWPPRTSDDDIVWLEPEVKPETPAAAATVAAVATTPARTTYSIAGLLEHGVRVEWYEAVALVQQLAVEVGATSSCRGLIELEMIELQSDGRLRVKVEAGFTPIVRSLGHLLHDLLALRPGPANLRLLAMQASSDVATFESATHFSRMLSNFERPGRLQLLEALYERASHHVPSSHAADLHEELSPIALGERDRAAAEALLKGSAEEAEKLGLARGLTARLSALLKLWSAMDRSTKISLASSAAVAVIIMSVAAFLMARDQWSGGSLLAGVAVQQAGVAAEPPQPEGPVQKPPPARTPSSSATSLPRFVASMPARAAALIGSVVNRSTATAGVSSVSPQTTSVRTRESAVANSLAALPGVMGPKVSPTAELEFRRAVALFERREYASAAAGFQHVIGILSNGELSPASSNLRTSAADFEARSRAALSVADPHVYSSTDEGVIEPVPFRKYLPDEPAPGVSPASLSVLELVIDTEGGVESARLRSTENRFRESWWASAAKTWRFQPALKDGRPVKFRKRMLITSFTPSEPQ